MEIDDVEDQLRREEILSTQVDELVNALERNSKRHKIPRRRRTKL